MGQSSIDHSGIFTISLDFELHWGGFEKWPLSGFLGGSAKKHDVAHDYTQYFLNTRSIIPDLLKMFARHEVHVTWATVGMLFHESRQELLSNIPSAKPTYEANNLSAYVYIEEVGIGAEEHEDPFHFAPSLIRQILSTPFQELGTHTFAHYYCNEKGQNVDQFREDIRAAQRAAAKYGRILRSLVFPRNQFNDEYLKACYEEGITSVRSNPRDWFWTIEDRNEGFIKRLNRGLDAYFPLGKRNTFSIDSLDVREGFPVCIPASRLLRPYRPKEMMLNHIKIERIKTEMTRAARHGHVYHLWWHPHNFGNYPRQNLQGLDEILHHYTRCQKQYGMTSLNMGEMTGVITNSLIAS